MPSTTYSVSESYCDVNCTVGFPCGSRRGTSASYVSIYRIAFDSSLTVANNKTTILAGRNITLNLTLVTNGHMVPMMISYGDGTFDYFNMTDSTQLIVKSFSLPGNYRVNASAYAAFSATMPRSILTIQVVVNSLNITCPVRVNATVGFACRIWAISNGESVRVSLASSPPLLGVISTIQTWPSVIDANITTNQINIMSALSNYTFNVSMVDTVTNGSIIYFERQCFIQVLPVFNCLIYTASGVNTLITGSRTFLVLSVLTSGFSVSVSVDFGDGTSMEFYNMTDSSQTLTKTYSTTGEYWVNVTAFNSSYSNRIKASLRLNVTGK